MLKIAEGAATAALMIVLLSFTGCGGSDADIPARAEAEIWNEDQETVGGATLTETEGGVKVELHISGLPPGTYGAQIHSFGKCEPPNFISAGQPFPPPEEIGMVQSAAPALPRRLGTFEVGESGVAHFEAIAPIVTLRPGTTSLFHPGGTSLVMHGNGQLQDTGGMASRRVACGVIRAPAGETVESLPPGELESAGEPSNLGSPGKRHPRPQPE